MTFAPQITIYAAGAESATLDGQNLSRVLHIYKGAHLTLRNLVVLNGFLSSAGVYSLGAGVLVEEATVAMDDCTITGCTIDIPNFQVGGSGAALCLSDAAGSLFGCRIEGNSMFCQDDIIYPLGASLGVLDLTFGSSPSKALFVECVFSDSLNAGGDTPVRRKFSFSLSQHVPPSPALCFSSC